LSDLALAAPSRLPVGLRALRRLRSLRAVASRDPATAPGLRETRQDRARTIDSVGAVGEARLSERLAWVPYGVDPELRKITVGTTVRKIGEGPQTLKKLIKASPKRAVWDVVFVGAGVHTAITANALAKATAAEPLRMLTIEAGDVVAANFAGLGDAVARN